MSLYPRNFLSEKWFCILFLGAMLSVAVAPVSAEPASAAGKDLAKIESLLGDPAVWAEPVESWLGSHNMYFEWLSAARDGLRYPAYRNSPAQEFLGQRCWETLVRVAEGKPVQWEISLYNRGDAGEITEEPRFMEMLGTIDGAIAAWAGGAGVLQPPERLANGMKIQRKMWERQNTQAIELKWSASENFRVGDRRDGSERIRFRAEYIQLLVKPAAHGRQGSFGCAGPTRPTAGVGDTLAARVKRKADGSLLLDSLPMVDQGQKGYCAVATTERILRYYGLAVDQHTLAQTANSSSTTGTSQQAMLDMLRRLGTKFGIKVRTHYDLLENRGYVSLIRDYNRAAKRSKDRQFPESGGDLSAIFGAMTPSILREARCERDKAGLRAFEADIERGIGAGIPLAWSVTLGIVEETPALPQAAGGHMRVICGYNPQTHAVLYSDSWGAGHEQKSIAIEDAWMITTGLYSFEPRR